MHNGYPHGIFLLLILLFGLVLMLGRGSGSSSGPARRGRGSGSRDSGSTSSSSTEGRGSGGTGTATEDSSTERTGDSDGEESISDRGEGSGSTSGSSTEGRGSESEDSDDEDSTPGGDQRSDEGDRSRQRQLKTDEVLGEVYRITYQDIEDSFLRQLVELLRRIEKNILGSRPESREREQLRQMIGHTANTIISVSRSAKKLDQRSENEIYSELEEVVDLLEVIHQETENGVHREDIEEIEEMLEEVLTLIENIEISGVKISELVEEDARQPWKRFKGIFNPQINISPTINIGSTDKLIKLLSEGVGALEQAESNNRPNKALEESAILLWVIYRLREGLKDEEIERIIDEIKRLQNGEITEERVEHIIEQALIDVFRLEIEKIEQASNAAEAREATIEWIANLLDTLETLEEGIGGLPAELEEVRRTLEQMIREMEN